MELFIFLATLFSSWPLAYRSAWCWLFCAIAPMLHADFF